MDPSKTKSYERLAKAGFLNSPPTVANTAGQFEKQAASKPMIDCRPVNAVCNPGGSCL